MITYEEYYPYGGTSFHGTASGEVSAKRYRYTGKERDEETGLYYFGARYYAAWLGRWTAADPAGMVDGPNLYWMTRDNPVRYGDRTGRQSGVAPDDRQTAEPQLPLPPKTIDDLLRPPPPMPIPKGFAADARQARLVQGRPEDRYAAIRARPPPSAREQLADPQRIVAATGGPFSEQQNRLMYGAVGLPVAAAAAPKAIVAGSVAATTGGIYELMKGKYDEAKKLFALGLVLVLSVVGAKGWQAGGAAVPEEVAAPAQTGAAAEGAAGAGAENVTNAVRLGKQLASEEGVAELMSGGGKVIAGPGTSSPIRGVSRLVGEHGGTAADWVKVTSTAPGHLQTHAYRNLVTGEVVELKSIVP